MGVVLASSLVTGAIYALTALGLITVYKATRVFNFAHGLISALSGYIAYQLSVKADVPFFLTLVAAIICGAVVGLLTESLLLRRLYQRSPLELVIATFGVSQILQYLVIRLWGFDERAIPVPFGGAGTTIIGMPFTYFGLTVIAVAIAAGTLLSLALLRTDTGLRLRATFEDPVAARLVGVNVKRLRTLSWAIGGGLGGLAGGLIAPLLFLSPGSMNIILITAFAAAVIGGFSSFYGAAAGGLLVAFTLNFGGTYISLEFRNLILYGVLLLFLWLRPHGIFGSEEQESAFSSEGESVGRGLAAWRSSLTNLGRVGQAVRIRFLGGIAPQWALHGLIVAGVIVLPAIMGPSWILNLNSWLITFIATAGVVLMLNYAKQFSLAQSAFMGLGAYASTLVVQLDGRKWWLGIGVGVGVGIVAALMLALLSRKLQGPYFAAITLALALALPDAANNWTGVTGGAIGKVGSSPVIGGVSLEPAGMYVFLSIFALAVFIGLIALRNSAMGRRMVLASDSPHAATSVGLSPMTWRIFVVSAGCSLGALAGSLNALNNGLASPDSYTFHLTMLIFVAAVVGGSITGAWWGSAIVVLVPVIFKGENELANALFGAVIIASLFLLPKDLTGMDVLRRGRNSPRAKAVGAGGAPDADELPVGVGTAESPSVGRSAPARTAQHQTDQLGQDRKVVQQ